MNSTGYINIISLKWIYEVCKDGSTWKVPVAQLASWNPSKKLGKVDCELMVSALGHWRVETRRSLGLTGQPFETHQPNPISVRDTLRITWHWPLPSMCIWAHMFMHAHAHACTRTCKQMLEAWEYSTVADCLPPVGKAGVQFPTLPTIHPSYFETLPLL